MEHNWNKNSKEDATVQPEWKVPLYNLEYLPASGIYLIN